jgi:hypothetical protein
MSAVAKALRQNALRWYRQDLSLNALTTYARDVVAGTQLGAGKSWQFHGKLPADRVRRHWVLLIGSTQ